MGIYLTKKNTTTNKVEKFKVAGNSGYSHPVGSIYMSTESTSPASMFGGTWEQILGKFLLSSDDVLTYDDAGNGTITTAGTYHAGATGGSADAVVVNHNHTWQGSTTLESGHNHNDNRNWFLQVGSNSIYWSGTVYQSINNSGVDGAGKNMPPYLVVYCWKRIS